MKVPRDTFKKMVEGRTEVDDFGLEKAAEQAKIIVGKFEKFASGKSAKNAIIGALLGSGVGVASDMIRPADEDENRGRRALMSGLLGAGVGATAGYSVDPLLNIAKSVSSYYGSRNKWLLGRGTMYGAGAKAVFSTPWAVNRALEKLKRVRSSKFFDNHGDPTGIWKTLGKNLPATEDAGAWETIKHLLYDKPGTKLEINSPVTFSKGPKWYKPSIHFSKVLPSIRRVDDTTRNVEALDRLLSNKVTRKSVFEALFEFVQPKSKKAPLPDIPDSVRALEDMLSEKVDTTTGKLIPAKVRPRGGITLNYTPNTYTPTSGGGKPVRYSTVDSLNGQLGNSYRGIMSAEVAPGTAGSRMPEITKSRNPYITRLNGIGTTMGYLGIGADVLSYLLNGSGPRKGSDIFEAIENRSK